MQVILGTLLAALVPVVGFNALLTSEHFASFLVSTYLLSFLVFLPSASHSTISLPTLAIVLLLVAALLNLKTHDFSSPRYVEVNKVHFLDIEAKYKHSVMLFIAVHI